MYSVDCHAPFSFSRAVRPAVRAGVGPRDELRAEDVVRVPGVHAPDEREPRADAPHAHAEVVRAGDEARRALVERDGVDASDVRGERLRESEASE